MDEATFRILDTLSREIGATISIHQLTSNIKQSYGTGYYARIYNKLHDLSRQGLITITSAGRSSIPSLNFSNYALLDLLSEIEIRKKRELLGTYKNLQPLLMDIEAFAHGNPLIKSFSIINPERNARLNRAELLILLRGMHRMLPDRLIPIHAALRKLQNSRIIRIDSLLLTDDGFRSLLISAEHNALKEMLSNRITFYNPNSFWLNISVILRTGGKITLENGEYNPAKSSDSDLYYNLSRFGYRELGIQSDAGSPLSIECVIAAIMMRRNARLNDSIPIILAKNKADYALLIFLSQKYGFSDKLLGILGALERLVPTEDTAAAIEILESMGAKRARMDEKALERKMKLYNAIG